MTKPRKGTETQPTLSTIGRAAGYEWQNPERGRKHFSSPMLGNNSLLLWMTKPRKGTETYFLPFLFQGKRVMNDKTPKGDGNSLSVGIVKPTDFSVMNDKTPKGDGNYDQQSKLWRKPHWIVMNDKTPKGDGNSHSPFLRLHFCAGYEWQNPERGRKHTTCVSRSGLHYQPLWMTKPRKGTETISVTPVTFFLQLWMTKPRKGTETCVVTTFKISVNSVMNDKTPKGDGNFP